REPFGGRPAFHAVVGAMHAALCRQADGRWSGHLWRGAHALFRSGTRYRPSGSPQARWRAAHGGRRAESRSRPGAPSDVPRGVHQTFDLALCKVFARSGVLWCLSSLLSVGHAGVIIAVVVDPRNGALLNCYIYWGWRGLVNA